jgi:hypothetical protein
VEGLGAVARRSFVALRLEQAADQPVRDLAGQVAFECLAAVDPSIDSRFSIHLAQRLPRREDAHGVVEQVALLSAKASSDISTHSAQKTIRIAARTSTVSLLFMSATPTSTASTTTKPVNTDLQDTIAALSPARAFGEIVEVAKFQF